ncbi:MAG: glycosyltransferase family 4 protein [Candidatus Omnitrophota bacterium]|nr:glycosyltransferase family 4 protein [Candidatus Omnitrophota bacterium]MBU1928363.1 glycosyltransferase family 4 protein [Candidatus Omnitrophota bacterium]MBU2035164.1 glycosyltransferase family 4 protein [Candidatus Omnitrophota bacterium]MBU2222363.1 glycosyltransferase family 4 protein [Candidatus Omnitrophota bacterium]MBU2258040.1 glycosyltransferase family 4 protein [Candidatus Omnitrophota bacterium]
MNILMIHPHDINSSAEPWTVRVVYIAKEFEKKGHKVKLVYFPLEQSHYGPEMISDNIAAIPRSRRHGPHVFLSNIFSVWKLAGWADIVHFQKCFYNAAIPAMVAAVLRGKHLHYDWDDWEVKIYEVSTSPGLLRSIIRRYLMVMENTIPRVVDSISVASRRLRTECLKLSPKNTPIVDAHVGADLIRFNPQISGLSVKEKFGITKPLILYLGQLHGGQYVELFIRTAKKLISDCRKDFSFMILGDGYMANDLKKMANQLDLNGSVIFAGAVSHELVPQYIAAADVCVACFEENEVTSCKSPLKIVEYLACGKAIVSSRVGEVPEMLQDAGVLTIPGDPDSLALGIIKVLSDPEFKDRIQKSARKRAEEKYNWEVSAGNILRAYLENSEIVP